MEIVIGLGGVGCRIAREFERYIEYKVYKIDSEESTEENYLQISHYDSPEGYEKYPPKVKTFLRKVKNKITL